MLVHAKDDPDDARILTDEQRMLLGGYGESRCSEHLARARIGSRSRRNAQGVALGMRGLPARAREWPKADWARSGGGC